MTSTSALYQTNPTIINPNDIDNPYGLTSGGSAANEVSPPSLSQQYKHSTVAMPTCRRWRKHLCIGLLLMIAMAITIGISMLMQRLFFRDKSDEESTTPTFLDHNPNTANFPSNKKDIDQAWSPCTIDQDGGGLCWGICQP